MIQLLHGDCRELLPTLPDKSVQCCVTSPPYFGLRKYGDDAREIGQESTPALYVAALVEVFAQVWRVLRDDGVLWLNLGDSYTGGGRGPGSAHHQTYIGQGTAKSQALPRAGAYGLPDKNLIGIPWRVAFALQDAGWILRSDIIWSKPNCMPESVTDRPTRAHEYLFLFSKQPRYFYDAAAIAEPIKQSSIDRINQPSFDEQTGGPKDYGTTGVNTSRSMRKTLENFKQSAESGSRNRRTVWTIATQPFSGAHFATMPEALIEPCILAGSSAQACETCGAAWGRVVDKTGYPDPDDNQDDQGRMKASGEVATDTQRRKVLSGARHAAFKRENPDRDLGFAPRCACAVNTGSAASVVLDPFAGSGTVLRVAQRFQRSAIGIDLSAEYIDLQEQRTDKVQVEMFV